METVAPCPREGATPHPAAPPGLGFPVPSSEGTKPVAFEVLTGPQCAVCLFLTHKHTHIRWDPQGVLCSINNSIPPIATPSEAIARSNR